jgi:hydroxymethylbilane synthase
MRLGTRRSALALAQAQLVAGMLGDAELVPLSTGGDAGAGAEDKSRWVDGLERALLDGEIDLAVHSAKDLPGELAPGLELLGAPARAGAEDALCGAAGLDSLGSGARVGTSSLRRVAQLRSVRPDLDVVPVRGNVDTRLAKLASGSERLDAIVLGLAGLQRLGREAEASALLDPARFVPAPGQGTVALQGRGNDESARHAARRISDPGTLAALNAERALARALGADCHTALGAHGRLRGEALVLRGWVGLPDGAAWALDEQTGSPGAPDALGELVAERLRAVGAEDLLAGARAVAQAGDAG